MGRSDQYRAELHALAVARWPGYLRERSGLPGPRGNIELAQAVADEGDRACFDRLIATGDEYLTVCGVVGLRRLLAEGAGVEMVERLRGHAGDARWRVREAVAMALQRLGDADLRRLRDVVTEWADDRDPLVQRAAAGGICEPRLLTTADGAGCALDVCARATRALVARPAGERRDPGVRTLRQALGYCWSAAVAADPAAGLARFRALGERDDRDVAWIVRENGKKAGSRDCSDGTAFRADPAQPETMTVGWGTGWEQTLATWVHNFTAARARRALGCGAVVRLARSSARWAGRAVGQRPHWAASASARAMSAEPGAEAAPPRAGAARAANTRAMRRAMRSTGSFPVGGRS